MTKFVENKLSVCIIGHKQKTNAILNEFLSNAEQFDIEYIFHDGRNALARDFYGYQKRYYLATGSLLSPGEYGCLVSHLKAYRKSIELGRTLLILEDDVTPKDFTKIEHLIEVVCKTQSNQVIHLGGQNGHYTYKETAPLSSYKLPAGFPIWRAAAYTIGPKAAQNLLNFQTNETRRADDWTTFTRKGLLSMNYIDLFDHPSLPNPVMDAERKGNDLNIKFHLKRKVGNRIVRLLSFRRNRLRFIKLLEDVSNK